LGREAARRAARARVADDEGDVGHGEGRQALHRDARHGARLHEEDPQGFVAHDRANAGGFRQGAQGGCDLPARIAAEAAIEEMEDGKPVEKITPFWRLIDAKSPIAKKLSCGTAFVAKMRKQEGID
jgi:hypothetical protein